MRQLGKPRRVALTTAAVMTVLPLVLAACGGAASSGKQIEWYEGTASVAYLATFASATFPPIATATVTVTAPLAPTAPPTATTAPAVATATVGPHPLSVAERLALKPNELGGIPILMYHAITPEKPATDDGYTRSIADFTADLQKLYDLGYYVVPLGDIIHDRIAAPAGKHPVALTFDDATAGQFRYLIATDQSVTIDPQSAVGIMESFFATHPDFGRGGYFAVPSKTCFDWQATAAEPDQTPYCAQKIKWLVANGYEVGDHTVSHADLLDLSDEQFEAEVGGGWVGLQGYDPRLVPNILAMPFGNYPDKDKHPKQRQMLRDGFVYQGAEVKIAGALMVGANPAASPASTDWDPLFIARIRAYDGELGSTEWLATLANDPTQLYTSDGDPNTITVPSDNTATLDRDRVNAAGKAVVLYDPETGATV